MFPSSSFFSLNRTYCVYHLKCDRHPAVECWRQGVRMLVHPFHSAVNAVYPFSSRLQEQTIWPPPQPRGPRTHFNALSCLGCIFLELRNYIFFFLLFKPNVKPLSVALLFMIKAPALFLVFCHYIRRSINESPLPLRSVRLVPGLICK